MTDDPLAEVEAAIAEVRREALKAAAIEAAVDAALVGLVLNLCLTVVPVGPAETAVGPLAGRHLLAAVAALAWGVAELAWTVRKPAAERFEAANPEVREALRTARDVVERDGADAVAADRESPVVRALCSDVLDGLRGTSSHGLVAWRRVTGAMVLLVAVGGITLALSAGAGAGVLPAEAGDDGADLESVDPSSNVSSTELNDGEEVLGEETTVDEGTRSEEVTIESSPGGPGDEEFSGDAGDIDGDAGSIDAQEAGYSSPEEVEEADLIAEYTEEVDDE